MNEWMAKRARNRFSSFILCTFALLASICFYLICVPNKFYKARKKKQRECLRDNINDIELKEIYKDTKMDCFIYTRDELQEDAQFFSSFFIVVVENVQTLMTIILFDFLREWRTFFGWSVVVSLYLVIFVRARRQRR